MVNKVAERRYPVVVGQIGYTVGDEFDDAVRYFFASALLIIRFFSLSTVFQPPSSALPVSFS
jgi:hypothetical protein